MPTNLPASFPKYRLYQKNSKQRGFGYTYFSEPCPPPTPHLGIFQISQIALSKKAFTTANSAKYCDTSSGFYTIFWAKFPDSSQLFGTQVP